MKEWLFRKANAGYDHAYWLYEPLYRAYKALSDRGERAVIRELVRPGMTVVDVGANVGVYTRLLSRFVGPTGRVFAFEPAPDNFRRLKAVAARLPNVTAFQGAVTDRSGETLLYLSSDLNVDHRTYDAGEDRRALRVPAFALDQVFAGQKPPDFIKMDIQGGEWAALQGMAGLLASPSPPRLLLEYWPWGLATSGADAPTLLDFLRRHGYTVETLRGGRRAPFEPREMGTGKDSYCNVLATRRAG